jgi:hypothetical protein
MPMLPKTFFNVPSQWGHSVKGSSLNDWTTSRCEPQFRQAYS